MEVCPRAFRLICTIGALTANHPKKQDCNLEKTGKSGKGCTLRLQTEHKDGYLF